MSVGKGACKDCGGGPQASENGNHDNPVSGNHPNGPPRVLGEQRDREQGGTGPSSPKPSSTHPRDPNNEQRGATHRL